MSFLEKIKEQAYTLLPEIIEIRRKLHANPELSYKEKNTADIISAWLAERGIPHRKNIGGYGIVGLVEGKNPGKIIALRADMDALPITEENQVEYKSQHSGIMHACGHDVHIACLLGTAWILNDLKDQFEGTVKLIFQPAEEKAPGGALKMIEEGVLAHPAVDAIFGQHVFPELEAGKVGFKSGKYMASSDEINLFIRGKGGHAAMPEKIDDTVLATAHILTALQRIVSRASNPQTPSVLSFGQIVTNGGAMNVIPDEVSVHGTFRTYDEQWRKKAHKLIDETARNTAKAFGCQCETVIDKGYPFLVNDDALTRQAKNAAIEFLGKANVAELESRMTAEDFACYSQLIPACFYRLGTGNKGKGITSMLHTPTFDVDESSMETGAGLMAWLVINQLT
ncbi:MAG TPA: amidohydrolase [Bacteroidetes bacterium]|nr:amidohydrolase [Bacteroidota bacterium]